MKTKILALLLFVTFNYKAFSQMYAGAGYVGGQLSVSGLDVAHGASFYLIKIGRASGRERVSSPV